MFVLSARYRSGVDPVLIRLAVVGASLLMVLGLAPGPWAVEAGPAAELAPEELPRVVRAGAALFSPVTERQVDEARVRLQEVVDAVGDRLLLNIEIKTNSLRNSSLSAEVVRLIERNHRVRPDLFQMVAQGQEMLVIGIIP